MIADLLNNSLILYLLLTVGLSLWLVRVTKIAGESERFAQFKLGKFDGFAGPGLHLISSVTKVVRLKVGDLGTVSGPEFVSFHGVDIPVSSANSFTIGDSVRILSFGEDGPVLGLSAEIATRQCPNCGHWS